MKPTRIRHRLEHAALQAFDRLINRLTPRTAAGLAIVVAGLAHYVFRFRVKAARHRIRSVFGKRYTEHEARRIAWQSWRNLNLSGIEILRSRTLTANWVSQHTNIAAVRHALAECPGAGHGAVLACAHLGSWEMAAVAGQRFGLPIFAIAAPQRNPYFNDWMNGLRARAGIDTILRGDATLIRQVVRRLKNGQLLAILPDVRDAGAGIPVPFLGSEARIGPGMALFARMANVPIIPCLPRRLVNGDHEIVVHPPIDPDPALDRDADVRRMTLIVMQHIETAIRQEPHQWFWYNKRWILDPVAPD